MQKKYRRYKQKLKRKYLVLSKRLLKLFSKRSKPKISHRNDVSLIPSGPEAFNLFLHLIELSEKFIELEYYIFRNDTYGQKIAEKIIEKSKKGVKIKIVYDFIGSLGSREFLESLKNFENIEVYCFNPISIKTNPLRWDIRDHRKLAIFDGNKAIVSGWNIGKEYFDSEKLMRDGGILIEGPAVSILRKGFYDIVSKIIGKSVNFHEVKVEPKGNSNVWIIESSVQNKLKTIYNAYCLAMMAAKKNIWIENAYFIPPRKIRKIIYNAVNRGVDVKIILPDEIDVPIVKYASYRHFKNLLLRGVKIFERKEMILHSKIALIDDIWVTIGSTNLHRRSLEKNYELNIVVTGEKFGQEAKNFIENDLKNSNEITYEDWESRPLNVKIKEKIASLFSGFF